LSSLASTLGKMMKNSMTQQQAEDVNSKMAAAIEDLRIKYEKIAEEKAKEEKEAAYAAKVASGEAAREEAKAREEKFDLASEDPELEALRKARMATLMDVKKAKKAHLDDGGGEVREIVEEDFIREVTSNHYVAVHFFLDEFMACKVMDKHFRALAPRLLGTKLLRLNAGKAPFFIAKLKVKTLPTLLYFRDGIVIGRQTGFEGLVDSATDEDFPTARLARAMRAAGALAPPPKGAAGAGDEGDGEEEEGSQYGGGGGDFMKQLAMARREMMASLEDEDGY
jgi:hypothetical protein